MIHLNLFISESQIDDIKYDINLVVSEAIWNSIQRPKWG